MEQLSDAIEKGEETILNTINNQTLSSAFDTHRNLTAIREII